MKKQAKFKLLLLIFCFFVSNYYGVANDTIRIIKTCAGQEIPHICVTPGESFTVNYGDGTIEKFIGTGEIQSLTHHYTMGRYRVIITGDSEDCQFISFNPDRADSLDLSSCKSIKEIFKASTFKTLRSLNTNNCSNLERISVGGNDLTVLDLRDNIELKTLLCYENKLSHIDLFVIEEIMCFENQLLLSYLYTISEMISDPYSKILGRQELLTKKIAVGDSIDFSDQKEFGGIATVFNVERGDVAAPQEDYKVNEGIITFYRSGNYCVIMTNAAIISHPYMPPTVMVAPFQVIDFVPVDEIVNLPTTAIMGVPLNLTGTVLPNNASYKTISWSVFHAGTTGATITGNKLNTIATGVALLTATIKDGKAIGTDYKQDFTIEVTPLGINAPTQELSKITVYPNPTNGELEIESGNLIINKIEILDIKGKIVSSHLFNILSAHHRIDISNLNSGIYFINVITNREDMVKKVVKL